MSRRLLRLAAFLAVTALLALPPPSGAQAGMEKFVVCGALCSGAGADCLARSSPEYCSGWMMGCIASCVAF
jgi:hypothetical protein